MIDLDLMKDLSVAERILYVEELRDSIASEQSQVEVTEAQAEELDRRLAAHADNPEAVSTWDEVKVRIRSTR